MLTSNPLSCLKGPFQGVQPLQFSSYAESLRLLLNYFPSLPIEVLGEPEPANLAYTRRLLESFTFLQFYLGQNGAKHDEADGKVAGFRGLRADCAAHPSCVDAHLGWGATEPRRLPYDAACDRRV
jgi:hypothetical protein